MAGRGVEKVCNGSAERLSRPTAFALNASRRCFGPNDRPNLIISSIGFICGARSDAGCPMSCRAINPNVRIWQARKGPSILFFTIKSEGCLSDHGALNHDGLVQTAGSDVASCCLGASESAVTSQARCWMQVVGLDEHRLAQRLEFGP